MKKCKWAGDPADEYCKNCDGIKMMVEGLEKSCIECNGYEEETEDVEVEQETVDSEDVMNPPEEETPVKTTQKADTKAKITKTTNNTPKEEKAVKTQNTKSQSVEKVVEEKEIKETVDTDGITITSLRYTSSATVKKGDNYYKFTAEEEWNINNYKGNIEDVREQLWATLNAEVDKQIDDLQNI